MPRLFVALEIGATAQRRVVDEQARLAETMHGASLRWMKYDQLHITLVFIGEVSDDAPRQSSRPCAIRCRIRRFDSRSAD